MKPIRICQQAVARAGAGTNTSLVQGELRQLALGRHQKRKFRLNNEVEGTRAREGGPMNLTNSELVAVAVGLRWESALNSGEL